MKKQPEQKIINNNSLELAANTTAVAAAAGAGAAGAGAAAAISSTDNSQATNMPNMATENTSKLAKIVSSPTALNLLTKHSNPTLSQIGKQTSLTQRHSQLYDSDTDEQARLISIPSARSHKFIIIPAGTAAIGGQGTSPVSPTIRQTTSTVSLGSMATSAMKRQPINNATTTTPTTTVNVIKSRPASDIIHQKQQQQPTMNISNAAAAISTSTVTFTIDDCELNMDANVNANANASAIRATAVPGCSASATSVINGTSNITPIQASAAATSNANATVPVNVSMTPSKTSVVDLELRSRFQRNNNSMHSISSVHLPATATTTTTVASGLTVSPNNESVQQQQQHYLHSNASSAGISATQLQDFAANNQIYSDVTSVRSLASIGIGSTDGRKLVIKRVPNTTTELLNLVNPPTPPPIGIDDEDDSFMDINDEGANLKPRQQKWGNKMQFVLACIGYSVGLGNVWRFPYMCYKSGGGVFLVPYCIILFICSIPLLFMELSVGQYTGRGPIGALGQLCPLFKGAGLASVVVSFLMSTYYSVIIGYSIYYFFTSFKTDMPWTDCNNRWNTPDCWVSERRGLNASAPDTSRTPSEEFFENKVLQISGGLEYPGMMRWELFACLICAWLMVYFATWKSIKSSAKVRYFTATFPFILIIILMVRAVTLEGAAAGLRYFFRPNWSELKKANVWINAASQNFNSLGITFGSMISFASYNKYNNNILRDTIAVSSVNMLTSLLVGIFAFATLGNLALEQNTNVRNVIGDGPGLIFVVYPQAMAKMPYAQLWAVMFFFMLLCLGLNSQFAIVEVVVTSIQDGFPHWIKKHLGYHEIVVLIVCVISFLFGLPNIMQGGIYYFQLMDHYAASVTIMFLAFCQMIAIAWFYGIERLSKNIKQMTGKAPSFYLKSCWILLGPCLLFAIWILSLINYQDPSYHNGRYKYPQWAHGIGWTFASLSLVCIPCYAIINLARASGDNFWQRLKITLRSNVYECKICGEHHCEHDYTEQEQFIMAQELESVYRHSKELNVESKMNYSAVPIKELTQTTKPQLQQTQQATTTNINEHKS